MPIWEDELSFLYPWQKRGLKFVKVEAREVQTNRYSYLVVKVIIL